MIAFEFHLACGGIALDVFAVAELPVPLGERSQGSLAITRAASNRPSNSLSVRASPRASFVVVLQAERGRNKCGTS
jgi:hypothetical protein